MAKDYEPDEADAKWLKRNVRPTPSEREKRSKWRDEQLKTHRTKDHELRDFLIAIVVMAIIILIAFALSGNNSN